MVESKDSIKVEFVRDYLESAKYLVGEKHITEFLESGKYSFIVRDCQLALELALKALFYRWSISFPKKHNVVLDLEEIKELFSVTFQKRIGEIKKISRVLLSAKEYGTYGDEESLIPPSKIYSEDEALEMHSDALSVVSLCESELLEFLGSKRK